MCWSVSGLLWRSWGWRSAKRYTAISPRRSYESSCPGRTGVPARRASPMSAGRCSTRGGCQPATCARRRGGRWR